MARNLVDAEKVLPAGSGKGTILLVEDEAATRNVIRRTLEREHYLVIEAGTGEEAIRLFDPRTIDLVLLDILLPGISGFEVCERLRRASSRAAIIMLTVLEGIDDRLKGLELGADDYMIKPFHPKELVARAGAVLRRSREAAAASPVQEVGDLRIDFHTQKCFREGVDLDLTQKEFLLLSELCANRGRIVERAMLLRKVWGEDHHMSGKSLDVYIGRLRQKVEKHPEEPSLILTVRGEGYLCG